MKGAALSQGVSGSRGASVFESLSNPNSARISNYYLGGRDNYRADRLAAYAVQRVWPSIDLAACASKRFLNYSVQEAAAAGVRQFLDLGTCMPMSPNLHEVAQSLVSDSRVVYVDNDPVAVAHLRAMSTSSRRGRVSAIEADAREPESIIDHPATTATLDLQRPCAVSMSAVLHHLPDDSCPREVVRALMACLAPGSFLTISHFTADFIPATFDHMRVIHRRHAIVFQPRSREEVAGFFNGLRILEPGVVPLRQWFAKEEKPSQLLESGISNAELSQWAGIATK